MTRLTTLLLSSFVLAFSSLAFAGGDDASQAQDQTHQGAESSELQTGADTQTESSDMQTKAFSEVDADNSGSLDESEAQLADIPDFQSADENGDGELDRNEYYAAVTERQS